MEAIDALCFCIGAGFTRGARARFKFRATMDIGESKFENAAEMRDEVEERGVKVCST